VRRLPGRDAHRVYSEEEPDVMTVHAFAS